MTTHHWGDGSWRKKSVGGHKGTGCIAQAMDKADRWVYKCTKKKAQKPLISSVAPWLWGCKTDVTEWHRFLKQQLQIHWLECQWKPSSIPMGYIFHFITQNNLQTHFFWTTLIHTTHARKLNIPVKSLVLSWAEHSLISMSLTSVAAGAGGWASGGMSTSVALLELWLVPSITICGGCESPPWGAITPAVGTAPFPNCHETHNTNTSFDNHRPQCCHTFSVLVEARQSMIT